MSQTDTAIAGAKRKRKSAAPSTPAKVPKTTDASTPVSESKKTTKKAANTPKTPTDAEPAKREQPKVVETVIKHSSKYKFFENHARYQAPKEATIPLEHSKILPKNIELWLFEVPKDMPIDQLDGLSVNFEGEGILKNIDNKNYKYYQTPSSEFVNLINIFPVEGDKGEYALGKPFSRQISIVEDVSLPQTQISMAPKPKVQQIQLENKYLPFGYQGPELRQGSAPILSKENQAKLFDPLTSGSTSKKKKRSSTKNLLQSSKSEKSYKKSKTTKSRSSKKEKDKKKDKKSRKEKEKDKKKKK